MNEQWEVGGRVMTEAECVSIVLNLLHNKGMPYPALPYLAYIMLPLDGIRHPFTLSISFSFF